ncbi:MAG: SufE family protein [Pedosphaera sp.]|nr:SufE family protein [Pedosphaera sp.]
MSLAERETRLITELRSVQNAQDRLAWIVKRGRQSSPLDEASKRDEFLVPGCLSRLWLISSFQDLHCFFNCDSDSAIVKGTGVLVCELYSDCSPVEILDHDETGLASAGISSLLTPNRRNGLGSLIKAIRAFASTQHGCSAIFRNHES